jgi:hypothetical protein
MTKAERIKVISGSKAISFFFKGHRSEFYIWLKENHLCCFFFIRKLEFENFLVYGYNNLSNSE